MPGSDVHTRLVRHGAHHAGWLNLGWKVLLALSILLLMSAGIVVPQSFLWTLTWSVLLVWGGLVAGISASRLFEGPRNQMWTWVALTVGAYAALALPSLASEPAGPSGIAGNLLGAHFRLAAMLGPVAALTLVAHLPRRDLMQAFRDWAIVMALALYAALGIMAMSQLVVSFGVIIFLIAVLFPPLAAEAALLLLRKNSALKDSASAHVIALTLAAVVVALILSLTLLNRATPLLWTIVFDVIISVLVGGALLLAYVTRPLMVAASNPNDSTSNHADPGRALLELSHGSILISLAMLTLLRLITGVATG